VAILYPSIIVIIILLSPVLCNDLYTGNRLNCQLYANNNVGREAKAYFKLNLAGIRNVNPSGIPYTLKKL